MASAALLIPSVLLGSVAAAGSTRASAAVTADPVIAAAGDIACDPANASFNGGDGTSGNCREKYTSDMLLDDTLAAVLPLGDNNNYCGSYEAYTESYDPSWGRLMSITHPIPGNHEYLTTGDSSGATGCDSSNAGAAGYFKYFGALAGEKGKGYYSYDIGTWHIVALNTNCSDAGGCGSGSPQYTWLQNDLAAHSNACTLAYFHIPLFSSGGRASSNSRPFWDLLYQYNAEVVLDGHDHIYERFAPQTPSGTLDARRGIREFIVGTGGQNHTSLVTTAKNSEVRNASTYGALELTLHPYSYDWRFVPEPGKTWTDAGTTACHGDGTSDTFPPTAPTNLTATATSATSVKVSWSASTDNVGVAGYRILRDGIRIGSTVSTTYVDKTVRAATTYTYRVRAYDAAGNLSDRSNAARARTPAAPADRR